MSDDYFERAFAGSGVMAILRGYSPQRTVELATRAWDAGIDVVEVPIQTAEAEAALAACVQAGMERGRQVGAGTVVSVRHVERAAAAGAANAAGLRPARRR